MLIVGIITWEDALREKAAWNTMVWIGLLIMMASKLNDYGLIDWFSEAMPCRVDVPQPRPVGPVMTASFNFSVILRGERPAA